MMQLLFLSRMTGTAMARLQLALVLDDLAPILSLVVTIMSRSLMKLTAHRNTTKFT